jgi:heat shock protein HslJ
MSDGISKKIYFLTVLFLILFLIYLLYKYCFQKRQIKGTYINTNKLNFPNLNKFQLNIDNDNISVNVGCNTISGIYEIKDDTLYVGPLSMTKKYCSEEEENLDLLIIKFLSERPVIYMNDNNNVILKHLSGLFVELKKI